MPRVTQVKFVGTFSNYGDAAARLKSVGDLALVERDMPRMLMLNCPCGCGDTLVINLDRRAGPAWRIYRRRGKISLFPSYWRDSACESHFVLWNNHVYWCDWEDEDTWSSAPAEIEEKVERALTTQYVAYDDLAAQIDEVPWDVLRACHALLRKGKAETKSRLARTEFRRTTRVEPSF